MPMSPKDKRPREPVVLDRKFIAKGTVIIREGEQGAVAYLVQSGQVQVYSEAGGKKTVLGILGPGEIFGEMALFNEGLRTASVQALEDCNVVTITRQSLEEKLKKSDPTIRAIVRMAFERLDGGNKAIVSSQPE
jgi:CRP-like cAMP-binding protein